MTAARKNAAVQAALTGLDADMVGVARLEDIKDTPLEAQALRLLPSARSVVVVGMEIWAEFLDLTAPERPMGAANTNELFRHHLDYLRGRLGRAAYDVAKAARHQGFKALPLPGQGPAVDGRSLEAVISYKHAAEAAGLGKVGMSGLLVTHRFGPRVQLAVCLTEVALKSTAGDIERACRYCNVCVGKCPAHALGYPKEGERCVINQFACRTYLEAAGGCSECMRVCPIASPRYN